VTARSPLADRAAELSRLGAVELPFLTQIDVRVDPDSAAALGFPVEPNTSVSLGGRDVLWLGPDEWLVIADAGTAPDLLDELEAPTGSGHRSVVDVSANRAVFELTRADRHELVATACPLDLHPRSWGEGRCAQTVFGTAQILLHERAGATRVFVRPSFAGYVVELLLVSA
jgi:sarcosine oxidase, subunit gamma